MTKEPIGFLKGGEGGNEKFKNNSGESEEPRMGFIRNISSKTEEELKSLREESEITQKRMDSLLSNLVIIKGLTGGILRIFKNLETGIINLETKIPKDGAEEFTKEWKEFRRDLEEIGTLLEILKEKQDGIRIKGNIPPGSKKKTEENI